MKYIILHIIFYLSLIILYYNIYKIHNLNDNKYNNYLNEIVNVDIKFCGKSPCQIFLPYHIGEQETRSQLHIRQLAYLSGILNRTFIMPNMYNGRASLCNKQSIDQYYNTTFWKNSRKSFFDFKTVDEFLEWIDIKKNISLKYNIKHKKILAQKIEITKWNPIEKYLGFDKGNSDCFIDNIKFLDHKISLRYDIDLKLTDNKKDIILENKDNDTSIINFTNWIKNPTKTEIISVWYYLHDLNKIILEKSAYDPIPYNIKWENIANKIIDNYIGRPYITIHWRMETIKSDLLFNCSKDLINFLKKKEWNKDYLLKYNIFFMTDYPHIPGDNPASTTFHPLDDNHLKSINFVVNNLNVSMTYDRQHFEKINKINNNTIPGKYGNNYNTKLIPVNSLDDTGLLGIIDQLIAVKSNYYLIAHPKKCGRRSTYSLHIIDQRKNYLKYNGFLENIFNYWN